MCKVHGADRTLLSPVKPLDLCASILQARYFKFRVLRACRVIQAQIFLHAIALFIVYNEFHIDNLCLTR